MKHLFSLLIICFATLSLEAQTISFAEDAEMRREIEKKLNDGSRADGCTQTFLLVPEDPQKPGFKKDLPLGVDLKPLLQSYITNGTKKFLLSGVGDAIGCDAFCASQALTDWHLKGQLFGWDIAWGRLDTIVAKQPGKYIIVGYTQEGCAVVETFYVAPDCSNSGNVVKDTIYVTNTITIRDTVKVTEIVTVIDTITDPNSVATTSLEVCEELGELITVTSLQDLSNLGIEVTVSPNPTADRVRLNMNQETHDQFEKIDLYSSSGQFVLSSSETEITISELPTGMYQAVLFFKKGLTVKVNRAILKVDWPLKM